MATWARALVQGSHNTINFQREFSFRCLYQVTKKPNTVVNTYRLVTRNTNDSNFTQNRPCQLLVHLDRGFSLVDSCSGLPAKVIWTYSFDKLKASADDGNRLLFLDFGGDEGEIVSSTFEYNMEFLFSQLRRENRNNLYNFRFHFMLKELDMERCPKPVVFVLHNCLSAKVHSLT